jgi:dynein heavy chain, axonemal
VSKRYTEGIEPEKIKGLHFTQLLSYETGDVAYEYVDDMKKVVDMLDGKMYEYNLESSGKLELVFFKETVEHILKIFRVLSQPRGNAMLIGVGGSGKQSLSKLASFIANCKISQLEFGKNYGI